MFDIKDYTNAMIYDSYCRDIMQYRLELLNVKDNRSLKSHWLLVIINYDLDESSQTEVIALPSQTASLLGNCLVAIENNYKHLEKMLLPTHQEFELAQIQKILDFILHLTKEFPRLAKKA